MKSAFDIALYFLNRVDREAGDTISALKLQKLVYYAQVWSMVLQNHPIFSQPIEAWRHGPVVRELWETFQTYKYSAIPTPETDLPDFEPAEYEILEFVWQKYGELSAHCLSELTHAERPWQQARHGLEPDERSNTVISLESMRAYHAAESPWGIFTPQQQKLWEILVYELLSRPDEFRADADPTLIGLKNALLDAIERSNPHYTPSVTEALDEAFKDDKAPAMTANEFRSWLTEL